MGIGTIESRSSTVISSFVSSICVYLRDIKYLLDIVLMMWFWLTPIVYKKSFVDGINIGGIDSIITKIVKIVILHNPLSVLIISYKDIMLKNTIPSPITWIEIFLYTAISLFVGYYIFEKLSKEFAENL